MINFDEQLRAILGAKYQGCTQQGDKLIEWHLQPGESATTAELKQVYDLILPRSGHPAQLVSVDTSKVQAARVKRLWNGVEYFYDCYVTENIVDQYQAGNIAVGDYLWVEFLDESEDIGGGKQIVIGKVWKV